MRADVAGSARVRPVVLGVLWLDVLGVLALAVVLVRPQDTGAWVAVVVALAAHAVVHALVLRSAVTPWVERRPRDALGLGLVALTAVAGPVLAASAAAGEEPWAWVLGFSVGALVVVRWWLAGAAAALGALGIAVGFGVGPGSVRDSLVYAGSGAVLAGGLTLLVVWMLRVLVGAEEGREAQARLAVADERLRVSRDLHDVLSHRLTVLALRAELAGDRESQELANRTLSEVRSAVHGVGTVDLVEQLRGAELVLHSAGVEVDLDADPVSVGAAGSQLLGAAVREAVTNVLRHSEARRCRITLRHDRGVARLEITNDGAHRPRDDAGTGLSGLAERAHVIGAQVVTRSDAAVFVLTVEVPS